MVAGKNADYTEEQLDNTKKFLEAYSAVPDGEKPQSIAVVNAFMEGMTAQRLLDAKEA